MQGILPDGIIKDKSCVSAVKLPLLFLHFLLYLGVKDLVIVGLQACILNIPRLGVIIIGLQSRQYVLGQVGCGVMLGLGVGQKGVQEEQDDEQTQDEFVADEFLAFISEHKLFLYTYSALAKSNTFTVPFCKSATA